jgi:hypothetical protein
LSHFRILERSVIGSFLLGGLANLLTFLIEPAIHSELELPFLVFERTGSLAQIQFGILSLLKLRSPPKTPANQYSAESGLGSLVKGWSRQCCFSLR